MNMFIFYTCEGYTFSPTDEYLENMQVLGTELGENREEALQKLISRNYWIIESGFDVNEIIGRRLFGIE